MSDLPLDIAVTAGRDIPQGYLNGVLPPRLARVAAAPSIVVLVGLQFEARIAAAPRILVVCRGADVDVSRSIGQAVDSGCRMMVSFGVAAGLDPGLRAGDCIIANEISDASGRYRVDPLWCRKLSRVVRGARTGCIAGIDAIVADPAAKLELHRSTGAVAADMESHIVARAAAKHGIAFAAIRVVLDPAHRMLPDAALAAAGANGAVDTASLARAVLARPSQLTALGRLAFDAYAARKSLLRLRRLLGS